MCSSAHPVSLLKAAYAVGQQWLQRDDIMGRAVGFLPYFGMITVWLTDYPIVKFVLLGVMGLFAIFAKDQ
jgi:signal peptidase